MHRRVLGVVLLVVGLGVGASANMVTDPGFEGVGSGAWNPWSSHGNMNVSFDYSAVPANVYEGSESFAIQWSSTVPQWNLVEAKQDFSVTAGYDWNASIYAKSQPLNGAEAYLETIFLDAGMNEVGKMKSEALTGLQDWTLLSNVGKVADNATSARFRLVVFTSGGDSSSGSVFFDNASATASIPEPATVSLLGLAMGLLVYARRSRLN